MKCKLLAVVVLVCLFFGCSSIKQINLKTAVSNEVRGHKGQEESDHRFGALLGPEINFKNGVKTSVIYRNRITDFNSETVEHGCFIGATVPIWINPQGE